MAKKHVGRLMGSKKQPRKVKKLDRLELNDDLRHEPTVQGKGLELDLT
jgi:hypothetical protein